ncbi:Uncharacterised protein [Enterococcus faecium]|nr:Uncharacterised protein [Enterococcus faecium]SMJ23412.1 Uncharacterised protein [Enterococcus faecium]SMJ29277.1 Uncharacterised protein [Enterococcus faecium]SMJ29860.1 Uncharacterised protein [Enterococcus faecium]SMJ58584.1 Uncharacterised protein [Enterococcus faecium]
MKLKKGGNSVSEMFQSDRILHLSLGLDVLLNYNKEGTKIKTVQLSKSRLGELIRNQTVTRTSIMKNQKIGLIIGCNTNIVINVEDLIGFQDKTPFILNIDSDQTEQMYEGKDIFQMSHFEFIVSNEQDLRPSQIKQLYYINRKFQDYLQEQEAAKKAKKRKAAIRRSVIANQK